MTHQYELMVILNPEIDERLVPAALDKFLKGVSDKTSAENAQQLARALGIRVDEDAEYEELRRLFYSATDTDRQFVLETVRRLVAGMQKDQK